MLQSLLNEAVVNFNNTELASADKLARTALTLAGHAINACPVLLALDECYPAYLKLLAVEDESVHTQVLKLLSLETPQAPALSTKNSRYLMCLISTLLCADGCGCGRALETALKRECEEGTAENAKFAIRALHFLFPDQPRHVVQVMEVS